VVFAPPVWRQTLKAKFLVTAFGHCPQATELLAGQVREGARSVQDWAVQFNVSGTWIELWAEDVLQTWRWTPLVYPWRPPPPPEELEADFFSFRIDNARPSCRFSHRVLVGGHFPKEADPRNWERFKQEQHAALEWHLNQYREKALQAGASREIRVPGDLDLKLEVAAIYILRGMTCREIGVLRGVGRDPSVVSRWLKEILGLLDLPRRRPFSRARRN